MENTMSLSQSSQNLDDIKRRLEYYSRYNNLPLFSGKVVYQLHEDITAYLTQDYPSKEEKQKAHGNFIWAVKNSFSTPFQKEAVFLINSNIQNFDLSDRDKINFLNYMLNMKNYDRFHEKTYRHFSDFTIQGKAGKEPEYLTEQSHALYKKVNKLLNVKYKNPDNFRKISARIYPFLYTYSKEFPLVSHNLVEEYAANLFQMSSKLTFERVSLSPLKNLMERTVNLKHANLKMGNIFGETPAESKPQIDKKAVLKVLLAYTKHSQDEAKKDKMDNNLYYSMTAMMSYFVQNYEYKPSEVKELRDALGDKNAPGAERVRLYDMGRIVQRAYNESQPRKFNPRNRTIDPIKAAIVNRVSIAKA